MMDSSGYGSAPLYIHPGLAYRFVINSMPKDLLQYLDSIRGASQDPHCREIRLIGGVPRTLWFQGAVLSPSHLIGPVLVLILATPLIPLPCGPCWSRSCSDFCHAS